MFDATVHLGDLLVAGGFALGGWRLGVAFRDEIRGLRQTVYGSQEPPVEGLVAKVNRHEQAIGRFSFLDTTRPQ
jgi:hypothetical protein